MEESQEEKSELKQIRTFQGDVAEALGRQNESLVSIQQQERARQPLEADSESNFDNKKRDFLFLVIGSAFFIIIGSLGAWLGWREYQKKIEPPITTIPDSRFITVSSETELGLATMTREEFASTFSEKTREVPANTILHIIPAPEISTKQFFTILETQIPNALMRAFDKLFMIGSIGNNPFLIVKLASFENAFPGMLSWEKTMSEDLIAFFPDNNGLKTVTQTQTFSDIVVKNKDVRLLSAGEGTSTQPILMYSFFDNSMLIITDNLEALQTLIDRLAREKLSR